MKKLLILIGVLLIGMVDAQEDYYSARDVIYPYDKSISVIRQVKIIDVVDGNVVIYKRDGSSFQIKASAVYRNGNYEELNTNTQEYRAPSTYGDKRTKNSANYLYDPEYKRFESLYKSASGTKGFGVTFTIIGFVGIIAGASMITDQSYDNDPSGILLYYGGAVFFHVGIPFWISGGIKKRNNYNAMQRRKNELSLSLIPSNFGNGIGVALKF